MSDRKINDKDYSKLVERLDKLRAIGAISWLEWRDEHRRLLGMVKPADCVRVLGLAK